MVKKGKIAQLSDSLSVSNGPDEESNEITFKLDTFVAYISKESCEKDLHQISIGKVSLFVLISSLAIKKCGSLRYRY